jgi:hypothetical protein
MDRLALQEVVVMVQPPLFLELLSPMLVAVAGLAGQPEVLVGAAQEEYSLH